MFRNSKFYDDILTGSYSAPMEKEASEQESDIRDIISTFGDEELDAIAQELGMISKEASEIQQSLENSLLEDEGTEKEAGEEEPVKEEPEVEGAKEGAEEEAEKEAEEYDEFEMIKLACEEVEQDLAAQDCTLADYVYTLDESLAKYASEIADKAEKIAYVTDMPRVAVVQDLLAAMNAIADANIEE